jgi:signal transduction histidine kinase
MRSLFVKIVGWFAVLLAFSFVAFIATTVAINWGRNPRDRFTESVLQWQAEEAAKAWESGGAPALAAYLDRMNRLFHGRHRLLNREGRDILTGEAGKTAGPEPRRPLPFIPFFHPNLPLLLTREIRGGQYRFTIESTWQHFERPNVLPYYLWIVGVVLLLCYALAFTLVSPLRQLRQIVSRFGSGDLAARTNSRRRDEFGDVGRAFDSMADRIQTLLTAERRLLQDISHEIRSPLARLTFAVELARRAEDREAALDRIKKEALRMSDLVAEVVRMTRAEGDPEERAVTAVPLAELVDAVVGDCVIEADARKCLLARHIEDEVTVRGDGELLRRAVENILRNAIRYAPENTTVDVTVSRDGDAAAVIIRDCGPGIPAEHLDNIFRPFFRVDNDRSRKSGGVGLGLAIAQRAVRLHYGEIQAENAQPGLRVTVRIPIS